MSQSLIQGEEEQREEVGREQRGVGGDSMAETLGHSCERSFRGLGPRCGHRALLPGSWSLRSGKAQAATTSFCASGPGILPEEKPECWSVVSKARKLEARGHPQRRSLVASRGERKKMSTYLLWSECLCPHTPQIHIMKP